ncbi:MAG TPA: CRTAC1 family protein [Patescibacteria group bacterium]|nr:CRTAC1 family protein [Patescibacteria group bacterium]
MDPRLRRCAPALAALLLAAASAADPVPAPVPASAGAPAAVLFNEVTRAAGIDFVHHHGGTGHKYYIETTAAGLCWLDYDGDGRQDLYIVQSGPLPGAPRPPGPLYSRLYHNRGDGTFEDVTTRAGVANAAGYGSGCTAADYDNDGDEDLYVTNFGPSVLYRNNGDGTFTDVTAVAGVKNGLYAASAGWADYDLDGRPDLFVANYVDFTMNDQKYCGDIKVGRRSYCHPDAYTGLPDVLYHNEGNGRFREVARASGVWDPNGKTLGVVWVDFDGDGDDDLYLANDATPDMLYRNDGNGKFTDITLLAGVCCSEDGQPQSGMGTDAGDVDGDGWQDLFVTNLSNQPNELYRNLGGKGPFAVVSYAAGLAEPSLLMTGWGTAMFDYDNDGDLDIIVTNGHPMDDIESVSDVMTYAQRPNLYDNDGKGRFSEVGAARGAYFSSRDTGRGLAIADYDNDGDLDVAINSNNRPAVLLRNDGGQAAGHWITLRLVGVRSNRDALGAVVTITTGGRRQIREVRSASSYMSQNDMRLHFGLGAATKVDAIEIRWPTRDRKVETLGPQAADQFLTIREGSGVVAKSGPAIR